MLTEAVVEESDRGIPVAASVWVAGDVELLSRAIMRLIWVDSRCLAQILAAYDLTNQQFYTLFALFHKGTSAGCRMGDLAHQLHQSSATMTGIVTRLESEGLVERVMDPEDRRAVQARVTERGAKVLVEVLGARRDSVARALERIEPTDRRELLRLLDVYIDAVTANLE